MTTTNNDDPTILFDSREQASEIAKKMVARARHEILFFGATIDPVLFDNAEVVESIRQMVITNRKDAKIRLLVHSTQENIDQRHQLIPLARRMTTAFDVHKTDAEHSKLPQMYLIVDQKSYLFCSHSDTYRGRASFDDAVETNRLKSRFNEIWPFGTPDIHFRHSSL